MSSLNQLLERRRAREPSAAQVCHAIEAQAKSLVVVTATNESWVFPWFHLVSVHFTISGKREELQLTFASHEVKIIGANLAPIRDLVASVQLARVQPAPGKFTTADDSAPFIEAIHVTPSGGECEADKRPANHSSIGANHG
jgi:hypothetical protein